MSNCAPVPCAPTPCTPHHVYYQDYGLSEPPATDEEGTFILSYGEQMFCLSREVYVKQNKVWADVKKDFLLSSYQESRKVKTLESEENETRERSRRLEMGNLSELSIMQTSGSDTCATFATAEPD